MSAVLLVDLIISPVLNASAVKVQRAIAQLLDARISEDFVYIGISSMALFSIDFSNAGHQL